MPVVLIGIEEANIPILCGEMLPSQMDPGGEG